jgi:hypothetical protein
MVREWLRSQRVKPTMVHCPRGSMSYLSAQTARIGVPCPRRLLCQKRGTPTALLRRGRGSTWSCYNPTYRARYLKRARRNAGQRSVRANLLSKLFEIALVLVPLDHVAGAHCKRGSHRPVSGCNAARIRSRCRPHLLHHTRVSRTGAHRSSNPCVMKTRRRFAFT